MRTATAHFNANGLCEIKDAQAVVVATLSLVPAAGAMMPAEGQMPLIEQKWGSLDTKTHTVTRPDGAYYTFEEIAPGQFKESNGFSVRLVRDGNQWLFYDTDNTIDRFEAGKLLSRTLPNGQVLSMGHDTLGRLASVTGPFGNNLQLSYNSNGQINKVTHPEGEITYGYDANYNLNTVTYEDGSTRQYHYEDTNLVNHLTGITDERGIRYATWTYDSQGRAISSEHANNTDKVTFTYTPTSTIVTDASGGTREYHIGTEGGKQVVTQVTGDKCSDCSRNEMQNRTYDANGFMDEATDWEGNVTDYDYDARGLEVQRIEAKGSPQERIIKTQWHSDFRLPTRITEPDHVTEYTYDANAQLTVRKDYPIGFPLQARTTTYTYHPAGSNGAGLVATMDGPRTDVSDLTSYAYDVSGNLISTTNPLGHVTQLTDHNGRDLPGKSIDANGVETVLTYHVRGWLLTSTVKDPGGNTALDAVITFGYDTIGQVTHITLPDNSYLNFTYDAARRLTAIENNLGERIEYTLDAAGNRTQAVIKDSSSTIVKTQTWVFDTLGRLINEIGASNQITHYDYDSNDNLTQITDARANPTGQAFDALNRLITQTDPDNFQVGYTYDSQDRIKTVTDQRGLSTTYNYDAFGNLTSRVSPDTGTTSYDYDIAGNRIQMTDARGIVTNYSYDALNRLLTVSYPANPSENVTYTYDDTTAGNYGKGRHTRIIDESGQTDYTYDHRGNLIQKSYNIEGINYSLSYVYDLANNLTSIAYPSGRIVNYSRDSAGRIANITTQENSVAAAQTVISNVRYLPFGPIASYTNGNGMAHTMSYDQDYRTTDIETIGTNTFLDLNYSYDPNNNITTLHDQDNIAHDQNFEYDKENRLIQAVGSYGQLDYQYDGVGNRTQQTESKDGTTTTYTYSATSNQLNQINRTDGTNTSQRGFTYDAAGNLDVDHKLDGTIQDYDSNHANRTNLVTISNAPTASYLYNALGQRIAKLTTTPQADQHFHYDEGGQLLTITSATGTTSSEYIYLDTTRVGMLVDSDSTNQPPAIEITSPISGSVSYFGNEVSLSGTADDPEDGILTENIQWTSSLDGLIGTGGAISITSLSVGRHTIFANVADSGNIVGQSITSLDIVVNQPPAIDITSPVLGSTSFFGDQVSLSGIAIDPEDGDISANIAWSSDRDGVLGTGVSVNISSLSIGLHNITASVIDSQNTQVLKQVPFTIVDQSNIDFNKTVLADYAGNSVVGTVTIEGNGDALNLTGNNWQRIDFPYTVTANTVLEFDFSSSVQGEIHAIGLDDDDNYSDDWAFQLYGTQTWANQDYRDYPGDGSVKHYTIPVGQYFTGAMGYLLFVMDHDDVTPPDGQSIFSKVKVYENTAPQIISTAGITATVGKLYTYDADNRIEARGMPTISYALVSGPAGMTVSAAGLVSWAPQAGQEGNHLVEISASNSLGIDTQVYSINVSEAPLPSSYIDFNTATLVDYADNSIVGTVNIEGGGNALNLTGNNWQRIDFPYTVTANTVLEFEFSSSVQGEIHAIGLDDDNSYSEGWAFQLYGTQTWANQDYREYPGDGSVKHYTIPVGQYFAGVMNYLVFVMDHDVTAPNGQSIFSNVRVYEQ
ncbi:hypothetical protein ACL7TT_09965 [Microbulbifer sp. 2304DJ12-6]|uniref:hypothetical protein n=1 Tax=Microbulbifer sp. 2304DJ12-6 TaxID=3233340 RepID=UPI0039AEA7AB